MHNIGFSPNEGSAQAISGEYVDDAFNAPVAYGPIASLLGNYDAMRLKIEQVGALFKGDLGGVVHYFVVGNQGDRGGYSSLSAEKVFQLDGAVAALNSEYWSRALDLADMWSYMPQEYRDKWHDAIRKQTTQEFTEATVRATLEELLTNRQHFFAQRIDGVFRNLSHDHITNSPQGFRKRCILGWAVNSWGYVESRTAGHVADLRAVIAKFMGRDEPHYTLTFGLIQEAYNTPGKWLAVDGDAFRIRVYKKGTCHIEIDERMADRLNAMLAMLYPQAIPAEFRTPKNTTGKRGKAFAMEHVLVPFSVLKVLNGMSLRDSTTLYFQHGARDQAGFEKACEVLQMLGAVIDRSRLRAQFDYPPAGAVAEVVRTGRLPDDKSHQFYPTQDDLADEVMILADIGDRDRCLEPSAGDGALASRMPADRTTCVEISALRCEILRGKGFTAHCEDFLQWAATCGQLFDKIVLNPPFANRRAEAHLQQAAALLAPGGRLVAILPAGLHGKPLLPGYNTEWSTVREDQFANTAVRVAVYTADKPG